MKFIAKYEISYEFGANDSYNKIYQGTIVDIVKLWHSDRLGTRYQLDSGAILSAEAFNAGFEEYQEPQPFPPRPKANPTPIR